MIDLAENALKVKNTLAYFVVVLFSKKKFYNQDNWAQYYKTFMSLIYACLLYAGVFVSAKPFQSSLMFLGKTGAHPRGLPFRCSTLG